MFDENEGEGTTGNHACEHPDSCVSAGKDHRIYAGGDDIFYTVQATGYC